MRKLPHRINRDRESRSKVVSLFKASDCKGVRRTQKPVSPSCVTILMNFVNALNSAKADDIHRRRFEPGVAFAVPLAGYIRPRNKSA
jgi:hypothetical protein